MDPIPKEFRQALEGLGDIETARMALRWALERVRNLEMLNAEARRELEASQVERGQHEEKVRSLEQQLVELNELLCATFKQFAMEKERTEMAVSKLEAGDASYHQIMEIQAQRLEQMRERFHQMLGREREDQWEQVRRYLQVKVIGQTPAHTLERPVDPAPPQAFSRRQAWLRLFLAMDSLLVIGLGGFLWLRARSHWLRSAPEALASLKPPKAAEPAASAAIAGDQASSEPERIPVERARPVDFSYEAQEAEQVFLLAPFLVRSRGRKPMLRDPHGLWRVTVYLKPGARYEYRFEVVDSDNLRMITAKKSISIR